MKAIFHLTVIGVLTTLSFPTCVAGDDTSVQSTLDITAPEISTVEVPDKVYAGSNLEIEIQASDDRGIRAVTIFFRNKGDEPYTKLEMGRDEGTNRYHLVIRDVPNQGVEFYVEATDLAGNLTRDGQEFSPHSVVTLPEFDAAVIRRMKDGRLGKDDILALFSGNTVDGYHVRKNYNFTRYFAPDNSVVQMTAKTGRRVGRWRVTEDALCEQFEGFEEYCLEVIKKGETVTKCIKNSKGERVVAIVYKRFRYGNPDGL